MRMSKKRVLPRLRFPEFSSSREWEETTLSKLANFRRGSFPQPYGLPEWYDEQNGMPFIQVFDVGDDMRVKPETKNKISALASKQSVFIPKGTVIITIQGSIGRVAVTQYDAHIDRTLLLFERFHRGINKIFIAHTLQILFEKEKQKAPGGIIKTITKEVLSDFKVNIPDAKEQQKIADCLTSLDDLIVTENKKLEVLKEYKKGLMQKLFPAEGEAVPECRFPEFKGSGEWETNAFRTYIKLYRGSSPRPIQNYLTKNDGVNWIKIGDTKNAERFIIKNVEEQITNEGAKKSRYVNIGELILANSMSYGKTYIVGIAGCIYDGWFVLREYEKYFIKQFLIQLLNSDYLQKQYLSLSTGGVVQNISSDIVYATLLKRPQLDEQERIADCLLSLDDLITAQTEKIETLKLHKKGLMQGLFPSAQEVFG